MNEVSHSPENQLPMSLEKRLEKANYHLTGEEYEEAGIEFTHVAELYERTPENYEEIKHAYTMAAIAYGYAGNSYSIAENRINQAMKFCADKFEIKDLQDVQAQIYIQNNPNPIKRSKWIDPDSSEDS